MPQLPKHTTGAHLALTGTTVLGEQWLREAEVGNKMQPHERTVILDWKGSEHSFQNPANFYQSAARGKEHQSQCHGRKAQRSCHRSTQQ
jgi:hypothetical protein